MHDGASAHFSPIFHHSLAEIYRERCLIKEDQLHGLHVNQTSIFRKWVYQNQLDCVADIADEETLHISVMESFKTVLNYLGMFQSARHSIIGHENKKMDDISRIS